MAMQGSWSPSRGPDPGIFEVWVQGKEGALNAAEGQGAHVSRGGAGQVENKKAFHQLAVPGAEVHHVLHAHKLGLARVLVHGGILLESPIVSGYTGNQQVY